MHRTACRYRGGRRPATCGHNSTARTIGPPTVACNLACTRRPISARNRVVAGQRMHEMVRIPFSTDEHVYTYLYIYIFIYDCAGGTNERASLSFVGFWFTLIDFPDRYLWPSGWMITTTRFDSRMHMYNSSSNRGGVWLKREREEKVYRWFEGRRAKGVIYEEKMKLAFGWWAISSRFSAWDKSGFINH